MPYYRHVGEIPAKRHVAFRDADGHRFHEELMGQEGFSSRSALLYHRHAPSAITAIEAMPDVHVDGATADHPLTPRHLRTGGLGATADMVTGRRVLLANADIRIAWASVNETSPLYRIFSGVRRPSGSTRVPERT